jgi:hypothetical protein
MIVPEIVMVVLPERKHLHARFGFHAGQGGDTFSNLECPLGVVG